MKNPLHSCIIQQYQLLNFMAKTNPILIRNEEEESRQVRRDLFFVVSLNLIFLAALIGLYFFNQTTDKVDQFFFNLLKF